MRAAVAFLLLAWPLPYTTVLDRWLAGFTNVTIAALRLLVGRIPVAQPVSGEDGSLFAISHAGRQFVVGVHPYDMQALLLMIFESDPALI